MKTRRVSDVKKDRRAAEKCFIKWVRDLNKLDKGIILTEEYLGQSLRAFINNICFLTSEIEALKKEEKHSTDKEAS